MMNNFDVLGYFIVKSKIMLQSATETNVQMSNFMLKKVSVGISMSTFSVFCMCVHFMCVKCALKL